MKYNITALTSEQGFNYTVDNFKYNGDYMLLTDGTKKIIINLIKLLTVEIEEDPEADD